MPITSSNSLSEEVSMMTGTWLSRRTSRQTACPSEPGSFKSKMTQSASAAKTSFATCVNDEHESTS